MSLLKIDGFQSESLFNKVAFHFDQLQSVYNKHFLYIIEGGALLCWLDNNVMDEHVYIDIDKPLFVIGQDCKEATITESDMQELRLKALMYNIEI